MKFMQDFMHDHYPFKDISPLNKASLVFIDDFLSTRTTYLLKPQWSICSQHSKGKWVYIVLWYWPLSILEL